MIIYEILHKLPSLNEYVRACRTNKYLASKMKKDEQNIISYFLKPIINIDYPAVISFEWHEATKKRDLDNIAFAKKFILDAMVHQGILKNDNYNYVKGFKDIFVFDKTNKCVVYIERWRDGT